MIIQRRIALSFNHVTIFLILYYLNLANCSKLQLLPKLPSSILGLDASNCTWKEYRIYQTSNLNVADLNKTTPFSDSIVELNLRVSKKHSSIEVYLPNNPLDRLKKMPSLISYKIEILIVQLQLEINLTT